MSAAVSPPTSGLRPSARRVLSALDTRSAIMAGQTSGPGAAVTAPDLADTYMGGADMGQRTCSVDGCSNPHDARGLCRSHYAKSRRRSAERVCTVEGCSTYVSARGMCPTHYRRWRKTGSTEPPPPFTYPPCAIAGCDVDATRKGMCQRHYIRWNKWGDAHFVKTPELPDRRIPVEDRFWPRVDVGHPLGCWEWIGNFDSAGYGTISRNGQPDRAHRVAYELLRDTTIPAGKEIDHLCRNRRCVNPDHLEAVDHRTNARRGAAPTVRKGRRARRVRTLDDAWGDVR